MNPAILNPLPIAVTQALNYYHEYQAWVRLNSRWFNGTSTTESPPLPTFVVEGVFNTMDEVMAMVDDMERENHGITTQCNLRIKLMANGKEIHYWNKDHDEGYMVLE